MDSQFQEKYPKEESDKPNRKHGSPYDRGSADRYYSRPYDPHWYPKGTGKGERIEARHMSQVELDEYAIGWEEETSRKVW